MDPVWSLLAFIGLPLLLYLVLSHYYPLWKKMLKGENLEEEETCHN